LLAHIAGATSAPIKPTLAIKFIGIPLKEKPYQDVFTIVKIVGQLSTKTTLNVAAVRP
jgi:hypothetical protein